MLGSGIGIAHETSVCLLHNTRPVESQVSNRGDLSSG